MAFWILFGFLLLLLIFIIYFYNRLVRAKHMVEEAWSGVDVQLKRRANLVPNLLESVKGYMQHEKDVLNFVSKSRKESIQAGNVQDQQQAENKLTYSLRSLFAVAENYPELKANTNFLDLQKKLYIIEDDIQMARRYYNGAVRKNNILVESFPVNLLAGAFHFNKKEYFELEDPADMELPSVRFS